MINLGVLPLPLGGSASVAYGVSGDGSIVVGSCSGESGTYAFRWTDESGMVSLGDLPGGDPLSTATAISADGSTIVGFASPSGGLTGVLFQENGTDPTSVGDFTGGGTYSRLTDVCADGNIAIGLGSDDDHYQAAVWDPEHGLRKIKDLLAESGMPLEGWAIYEATAISDDGDTIVGNARDPSSRFQPWMLTGVRKLISGEDFSDIVAPVPVVVRFQLAPDLEVDPPPTLRITATPNGPMAPTEIEHALSSGDSTAPLPLLSGGNYEITASGSGLISVESISLHVEEETTVTLVLDSDRDGDGLSDRDEATWGTDPDLADTDGDGFSDGFEVAHGFDPLDPESTPESRLSVIASPSESSRRLQFYAAAGIDYRLEVSTDLVTWEPWGESFTGDGEAHLREIPDEAPVTQFFRLLREP